GLADGPPTLERHPFGEGDTVLLFSDGLIERTPAFDDDALDEHLQRLVGVPATTLAAQLRAVVDTVPARRRDDVAVLAITRAATGCAGTEPGG
ncbi:MAG: hypothetical protein QOE63_1956, partial [Acidimicrobiaceae bacterium]